MEGPLKETLCGAFNKGNGHTIHELMAQKLYLNKYTRSENNVLIKLYFVILHNEKIKSIEKFY